MNKRIQDAISRFGEEACMMAYDFNVNQGEGGTFIETNTGIPKRSQGAAIEAGEYLSKRRKSNPARRKNPTKELMAIPPEDWLEEADRRERAGDKQGAKTARQFARFLMGQNDAFENPVHRKNPVRQRIAVSLSKSQARKNPLLESGATISRNSGINRRAASMT